MLKLQKQELFQWDTNLSAETDGKYLDYSGTTVTRVAASNGKARIPDEWLQTAGTKTIWVCMADNTRHAHSVYVKPRPCPPDYASTPTQKVTFDGLVETVNELVEDVQDRIDAGEFTGPKGDKGAKGDKGDQGDDYVLTDDDKSEIAALVPEKICIIDYGDTDAYDKIDSASKAGKTIVCRHDSGISGSADATYAILSSYMHEEGDMHARFTNISGIGYDYAVIKFYDFVKYEDDEDGIWNQKTERTPLIANGKGLSSNDYTDADKAKVAAIPTKVSQLQNDSGFLTEHQDLSGIKETIRGIMDNGAEFGNDPVNTDAKHLMYYSKVRADAAIVVSFKNTRTVRAHKFSKVNDEYVFVESGEWKTASFTIEPDEFYYDFEVAFTNGLDISPSQAHVSIVKNSVGQLYNVVPGVTTKDEMRNAILAGKILIIQERGAGITSTFYCTEGSETANGSYAFYNFNGLSIRTLSYRNGNWTYYEEDRVTQDDFSSALGAKQAKLTAGDYVTISNANVIDAKPATYTEINKGGSTTSGYTWNSKYDLAAGVVTVGNSSYDDKIVGGNAVRVTAKAVSDPAVKDMLTETEKVHMRDNYGIASKQDLVNKLDAPSSPLVGKYLKISAVNADGSVVLENVDLPIATFSEYGLAKFSSDGFVFGSEGNVFLATPTSSNITSRKALRAVMLNKLDDCVKAAMCDGKGADWEPSEQLAARQRIGLDKEWVLKGTLAGNADDRGNIDTGVTVDLTGCTEMYIHAESYISPSLTVCFNNTSNYLVYDGTTNAKSFLTNVVDNGAYIDSTTRYSSSENWNYFVKTATNNYYSKFKLCNITKILIPTSTTSCNIKIYAR